MQALLQEIDQCTPPTDMPNLEPTFFQGLHKNIKLKIIDNLTAGTTANLGQNLRRYNYIVQKAIAAEEDQKRVVRQIQQMTRNLNPGRPATKSQGRAAGRPRVFLAHRLLEEETASTETGTAFTTTPRYRNTDPNTDYKGNTRANTPTTTRFPSLVLCHIHR
jgi:hypothetical protein